MPDPSNILESYFVKVGAWPDLGSFKELGKTLLKTGYDISQFSAKSAKDIADLGVQTTTIFTQMGFGLVKLTANTAQTDQAYRLLGESMLMTKATARAMQMTLDQLGVTLNQVAMDEETKTRFKELYDYNLQMGEQLDKEFDEIMFKIRSVTIEWKKFGTEFTVLVWETLAKSFKKLGYDEDVFLEKLKELNRWFRDRMPDWAEMISTDLKPAWEDFTIVVKGFEEAVKGVGEAYIKFTGYMHDDKSLENAKLDIQSISDATLEWIDSLTSGFLRLKLLKAEFKSLDVRQLIKNLDLYLGTNIDPKTGLPFQQTPEQSQVYLEAVKKQLKTFAILDRATSGEDLTDEEYDYVPELKELRDFKKRSEQRTTQRQVEREEAKPENEPTIGDLLNTVGDAASTYNIKPLLIASLIKNESYWDRMAKSSTGAEGLTQLEPAEAAKYAGGDPYNYRKSILGGSHYLSDLLADKYTGGNLIKALAEYNQGLPMLRQYAKWNELIDKGDIANYPVGSESFNKFRKMKEEGGLTFPEVPSSPATQKYIADVLRDFYTTSLGTQGQYGDITINGITINVPSSIPKEDWHKLIGESIDEAIKNRERRKQAQTAGGAHF